MTYDEQMRLFDPSYRPDTVAPKPVVPPAPISTNPLPGGGTIIKPLDPVAPIAPTVPVVQPPSGPLTGGGTIINPVNPVAPKVELPTSWDNSKQFSYFSELPGWDYGKAGGFMNYLKKNNILLSGQDDPKLMEHLLNYGSSLENSVAPPRTNVDVGANVGLTGQDAFKTGMGDIQKYINSITGKNVDIGATAGLGGQREFGTGVSNIQSLINSLTGRNVDIGATAGLGGLPGFQGNISDIQKAINSITGKNVDIGATAGLTGQDAFKTGMTDIQKAIEGLRGTNVGVGANVGLTGQDAFKTGMGDIQKYIDALRGTNVGVGATAGLGGVEGFKTGTDQLQALINSLTGRNVDIGATAGLGGQEAFGTGMQNLQSMIDKLTGKNVGIGATAGLTGVGNVTGGISDIQKAINSIAGKDVGVGVNTNLSGAGDVTSKLTGIQDLINSMTGKNLNLDVGLNWNNTTLPDWLKQGTLGIDASNLQNLEIDPSQSLLDALKNSKEQSGVLGNYNSQVAILEGLGIPPTQLIDLKKRLASQLLGINMTPEKPPVGTIPPADDGTGTQPPQPGDATGVDLVNPKLTGIPRPMNIENALSTWPSGTQGAINAEMDTLLNKQLPGTWNTEDIDRITKSILTLSNLSSQQTNQAAMPEALKAIQDQYNVLAQRATGSDLADVFGTAGANAAYVAPVVEQFAQAERDLEDTLQSRGIANSTIADEARSRLASQRGQAIAQAKTQGFQQAESVMANRTASAQQPLSMLLSALTGMNVAPQTINPNPPAQQTNWGNILGSILGTAGGAAIGKLG